MINAKSNKNTHSIEVPTQSTTVIHFDNTLVFRFTGTMDNS